MTPKTRGCSDKSRSTLALRLELDEFIQVYEQAALDARVSTDAQQKDLMERRLAEIPTEDWGDVQVDITPREYVLDYLGALLVVLCLQKPDAMQMRTASA
jgi:hypothetical protein